MNEMPPEPRMEDEDRDNADSESSGGDGEIRRPERAIDPCSRVSVSGGSVKTVNWPSG